MTPLKIEVTPALAEQAAAAIYAHDLLHGIVDKPWANRASAIKAHYGEMATAALTAAFQHPEFVRQVREQVMGCVPEARPEELMAWEGAVVRFDGETGTDYEARLRASLGRLLGEEGK